MILRDRFKQWLDTDPRYQIRDVQLEVIAEDFAIGFAFYLSDNYISRTLDTWDDAVGIRFTTKQVLEIYKKEKGL